MNQQRTLVYELRNKALLSEDMSETVLDSIEESTSDYVAKFADEKMHVEEWNLKGLADELSYVLMGPIRLEDIACDRFGELEEKVAAVSEKAYRTREAEFGPPVLRELERHLYLYTLDEHWRDHLYELDHLKGGIGLRAYGQRDPLVEYKKEAFTLFETLLKEVRDEFVQRLFRVQLAPDAVQEIRQQPRMPRQMVAQHAAAQAFAGVPDEGGGGDAPTATATRPVSAASPPRAVLRAGRNDPCPCGSGKKYKKCHMPIDEGVESGA
jgi:preprotein translocase subunit SecA